MLNVYVAAPYQYAEQVRAIHRHLEDLGLTPVSSWAECAYGPEDLHTHSLSNLRKQARANDDDLMSAHVVLVLGYPGMGGEMFAEARLAVLFGIPVVWVGRKTITAYRTGVARAENLEEALTALAFFGEVEQTTTEMTRIRIRSEFGEMFA